MFTRFIPEMGARGGLDTVEEGVEETLVLHERKYFYVLTRACELVFMITEKTAYAGIKRL